MKPSRRKTLDLKVKACGFCAKADKTKMRHSRDYCDSAVIKNGHCINFESESPKRKKKEV